MAVTISDAARERVTSLRAQPENQGEWLRIGVRGGGCSGFSYFLDFVGSPEATDKIFEFGDVKLCVDRKSYLFLNGMEVDFEQTLVKTGFVFKNPNATSTCSCGTSFTI
jgi:iron-sulfur cluster assembly protein